MPLYEFRCTECHNIFEELCAFKEIENIRCLNCHSKKVEKLLSRFATVKGGDSFSSGEVPRSSGCQSCSAGSCATCSQ